VFRRLKAQTGKAGRRRQRRNLPAGRINAPVPSRQKKPPGRTRRLCPQR
jgi:hypothetical protein